MSPHRKKGRGGGGGKTLAPHPSDHRLSPPLLPCKIIQERRALRHSSAAPKKASLTLKPPHLYSASRKLNPSGKPEGSSSLNGSSSDTAAAVVNSSSNPSSRPLAPSHSLDAGACRHSSPKSADSADSEKLARIASTKASGVGLTRVRRSAKEEDNNACKDSGKPNVLVAANKLGKEVKGRSRGSHRETGSESLRWSTPALLLQNGKCYAAAKRPVQGACEKVGLVGALLDDTFQTSEDNRFLRGSAGSTASVAEEPCKVERDDISFASAKSTTQRACADVVPAFGLRQEREFPMHAYDDVQNVSGNNHSEGPQAQAAAASGAQDGITNFSSALHRRLAVLEGKVSQIAEELRKTKDMLDCNYPRGSVVLTDIQGKISSIERAMTSRLRDLEAVPAQSEDEFRRGRAQPSPGSWSRPPSVSMATRKDSQGIWDATESCPRFASDHETVSNQLTLDGSASPLRTPAGLTSNQQELEDRLFPHRKLLKSRLSHHDEVLDSRAVVHSKLGDSIPQTEVGGHYSTAERSLALESTSPEQRPAKQHGEALEMTPLIAGASICGAMPAFTTAATAQDCGSCLLEKETARKDGVPGNQVFEPSVVSLQKPCQFVNAGPACRDPKSSSASALNCTAVTEVGASGRDASRSKENWAQGPGFTEDAHVYLECDESLSINDSFENQENYRPADVANEEYDDFPPNQLYTIGERIATAGWYVCEGEAIVLARDDGCCSYYDVANMEEKAEYKAPDGIPNSLWNDCWLIRAAGSDGRSNKYIVAASAGSSLDCGFCAWDFYSKDLVAYHNGYQTMSPASNTSARSGLIHSPSLRNQLSSSSPLTCLPLSDSRVKAFGVSQTSLAGAGISFTPLYQNALHDSAQWWYRPCGPLMASGGSSLRSVVLHDIRDGEIVMTWNTRQPILNVDYGSPLQWRNKDKLALAEEDAISIWDVNSMDSVCLQYIKLPEKEISAFQMLNADAECSGGVRQRLSPSKAEGYDGICCTQSDISLIDLRVPEGLGTRFPVSGLNLQSVFTQGDMILTGSLNKTSGECGVHQWSVRKAMPVCIFALPASNCHYTHLSLTQVWGSLDMVMAVNGNGLYIFNGGKEAAEGGTCITEEVNDVIGTQDLFNPSFDYANSRVLLISRDRPASWCYWP